MKLRILTTTVAAALAGAAAAGLVEDTHSKPVLAAELELAPFADVTQKITALGATINNPIVPTLLLTSGQQSLKAAYGAFRAHAPIKWQIYVQTPAWDVAATNADLVAMEDLIDIAVIYPSADGPARTLLNHPGATKQPDGTLHILAGEGRPDDSFVKFAADGKTCAIASTAALAAQALDVAAARASVPAAAPLLRATLLPRGLSAAVALRDNNTSGAGVAGALPPAFACLSKLADIQAVQRQRQFAFLETVATAELTLDLSDKGLDLAGAVTRKPGAKLSPAAGFALPAGALDAAPAAAHVSAFANTLLQSGAADETAFRADAARVADILKTILADARKAAKKEADRYAALFDAAQKTIDAAVRDAPAPAPSDWDGFALAFDAAQRPCLASVRAAAAADTQYARQTRLLNDITAAFTAQWPARKWMTAPKDGTWLFDWNALVDATADDAGVKPGDDDAKELEGAKKTLASVLGGPQTVLTTTREGSRLTATFAAPDYVAAAAASDGEARAAAALPEITAARPAAFFYLTPYAFVRDALLPLLAKLAEPEDAQQYVTMAAAMAPAAPNSAFAGAAWSAKDGSLRFLARITANELKNLGVAFNAFTAASMSSALTETDDAD